MHVSHSRGPARAALLHERFPFSRRRWRNGHGESILQIPLLPLYTKRTEENARRDARARNIIAPYLYLHPTRKSRQVCRGLAGDGGGIGVSARGSLCPPANGNAGNMAVSLAAKLRFARKDSVLDTAMQSNVRRLEIEIPRERMRWRSFSLPQGRFLGHDMGSKSV